MILNWTKRNVALILAGSYITNNYPSYFLIGSGSGITIASQTTLSYATDRQAVTSTNGSTAYKVTWLGDWNSVEMSGTQLKEVGMIISGTGTTGSMWSKTGFAGITFDGTNELRVQESWEIY
jgi:hypothetical protein